MALEERRLAGEQFVELTCGTENLSPYSSPSGYGDPPSYYHTEYEWQQHHQQPQQQLQQQQQQQLIESERHYYGTYPEGSDISGHAFANYSHQPVVHGDFYQSTHGLWPATSPPDPLVPAQLNQHHRFFSGIDLSQQAMSQQGTPNGTSVKPKRKRVQSHSQRKAANVRERKRMFHLNEAFDELRKRLPAFNYEKRLSRIETLRLAMTYISFMKEVSVGMDPKCVKLKPHGSELSPLPGEELLGSLASYSGSDNNEESNAIDNDSDCSNDELSNHSGGN